MFYYELISNLNIYLKFLLSISKTQFTLYFFSYKETLKSVGNHGFVKTYN